MQDTIRITGKIRIQHWDADGNLLRDTEHKNLVVSAGKTYMAARLVGSPTLMGYMALGTGTTAPAAGDTALQAEIAGSRTAFTSSNSSSNVATFVTTFGPGVGTGAVTEAGIFNSATTGTMQNRVTFSVVNKGAGDTTTITWTVTLS